MRDEPLHIVDGSVFFFRALFGVPDVFSDTRGRPVNGIKGYLHYLLDLMRDVAPRFMVVAFDESLTTCFRNDIYPPYKANRPLPDANVTFQLRQCQRLTARLGVQTLAHPRFEADDIIATLAARARRPVRLFSRDKDLLQLLRSGVSLVTPVKGICSADDFVREYRFLPRQYPDYQALRGDGVDNIPGVPGVGAKTAARLVRRFGTLERIYASCRQWHSVGIVENSFVARNLRSHRAQALRFRCLTRLHRQVPASYSRNALRVGRAWPGGLRRDLERLGLLQHFVRPLTGFDTCTRRRA